MDTGPKTHKYTCFINLFLFKISILCSSRKFVKMLRIYFSIQNQPWSRGQCSTHSFLVYKLICEQCKNFLSHVFILDISYNCSVITYHSLTHTNRYRYTSIYMNMFFFQNCGSYFFTLAILN